MEKIILALVLGGALLVLLGLLVPMGKLAVPAVIFGGLLALGGSVLILTGRLG